MRLESIPCCNRKIVKRRDGGDKGEPGGPAIPTSHCFPPVNPECFLFDPRGDKAGRVVVESCRHQFIANPTVKLFMKRFVRSESEPKSFRKPRSNDGDASSVTFSATRFTIRLCSLSELPVTAGFIELALPFLFNWTVDTLPPSQKLLFDSQFCEEINHSEPGLPDPTSRFNVTCSCSRRIFHVRGCSLFSRLKCSG